jgi:hypothetical protein
VTCTYIIFDIFHGYSENYCVGGLFPSSGILENRKHDVSETGIKANLNHCTTPVRFT